MCTLPFPNLPINLCFFLPLWSHSSLRSCETEVRSCHCPALPLQGLLILLRAKASISVVHSEALHLDTGSSPLSSFPFSPYLTKNTLKKKNTFLPQGSCSCLSLEGSSPHHPGTPYLWGFLQTLSNLTTHSACAAELDPIALWRAQPLAITPCSHSLPSTHPLLAHVSTSLCL